MPNPEQNVRGQNDTVRANADSWVGGNLIITAFARADGRARRGEQSGGKGPSYRGFILQRSAEEVCC